MTSNSALSARLWRAPAWLARWAVRWFPRRFSWNTPKLFIRKRHGPGHLPVRLALDLFERRESPTNMSPVGPGAAWLASLLRPPDPLPALVQTGNLTTSTLPSPLRGVTDSSPLSRAISPLSPRGRGAGGEGAQAPTTPTPLPWQVAANAFTTTSPPILSGQDLVQDPLGLDELNAPRGRLPFSSFNQPANLLRPASDGGSSGNSSGPSLPSSSNLTDFSFNAANTSEPRSPLFPSAPAPSPPSLAGKGVGGLGSSSGSPDAPHPAGPGPHGHKASSHDPMWVLDANKAIVLNQNVAENDFSNWNEDLRAQVSGATVSTYSWNLTNAPDAGSVTGSNTYRLQFTWNSFTGAARTDTISVTETPTVGNPITQTYTFKVTATDSPAWSSAPVSYSTWASVITPDALSINCCPPAPAGSYASLGLTEGDVETKHMLPIYQPSIPELGLVYSSVAANPLPIFLVHFQIDPTQAAPPTVKAQLTLNGTQGSWTWYNTSSLNPGDIMQIALQGNATSLSTSRYSWSIAVTANYGTPVTTNYSGSVDIVNSMSSPFGAGWSLNVLQRIWPVTGGVILEEPGGLSLWFANGQQSGSFVTPPGDTSTLALANNVYTRSLKDGTQINFNSSGYQTTIVDRNGNTLLTFGWNGSNQLTTLTDLNALVTTISYNGSGKATTFLDPASRATTLAYDASNTNLTSITDPDSALWQYGYDSADRMTTLTDPRTYTTTFAYNTTAERIATVTRADSTTELLTAEQMNGIPASGTGTQSNPATPVLAAQAQASFTDPNNNIWNTNLDWLGFGDTTQGTDPLGDMSVIYRDANGFPWLSADALGRRNRTFFDTKENPTEIVLPDDRHMQYTYNSFSEPTTYTDPRNAITTYSYDTSGNVTLVTDPLSNQTKYTYTTVNNTKGLRLTMTDPLNHTTTYGYDTRGRLQTVTDPTSAVTTYGYDTASDLTAVTNPLGFTTTNSYDAMGRLLTVKQPDSNPNNHPTITYTYDAAGNQTSITDPAGNTTTTAYDKLNRPTTITDALNHNTLLGYDNAGNLTTKTDRNRRQTTYSYDAANRWTGETWVSGNYIATYAYDAASELTSETDNNSNYSLGYDTAGRLITVDNVNTPNAPHVLLTYTYDAADNRTGLTDNLNGSVSYTYDADHHLTNVSMTVNGTAGPQVTMTPDPYGRLSLIVRQSPGGKQIVTNYSYDADNRVTYIQQGYYYVGTTLVNQLALYTYAYDNAGQETGYTGPEGSITLAYDARGELTGVSGAWSESYSYDLNGNRTMTGYTTSTGNRLTSDGTYNYTYNNEGNMLTKTRISDGQVTNFTWDYRNRLTEVTVKTSTGTTLQDDKFTYDVQNQRIGKNTLSGGQSWTIYDRSNPYADFNSGGSLTYRYLYGVGLDTLLARYDGTNTVWYLADKLGSVRLLVDKNANIQDTITYYSFGKINTESGTGDRFKFTGHEWDSEIGLYYYRARYYDPATGRFLTEDPMGFAAGDTNLFRYVFNGPTNFTDPNGQCELLCWGIIMTATIIVIVWNGESNYANAPAPGDHIYGTNDGFIIGQAAIVGLGAGAIRVLLERYTAQVLRMRPNCFPSDTLVATEKGLRPICEVEANDLVWSYDFVEGAWRFAAVDCRHDSKYDGDIVTVDIGLGEVTATAYHPFWVIEGKDLENRAALRHVDKNEDRGGSLSGRWVNSHELREGDVVFLRDRGPVTVQRVWRRHDQIAVCNLTVRGLHTFAVGENQILVHNQTGTGGEPTNPISGDPTNINPNNPPFLHPPDPTPPGPGYTWNPQTGIWDPPPGSGLIGIEP